MPGHQSGKWPLRARHGTSGPGIGFGYWVGWTTGNEGVPHPCRGFARQGGDFDFLSLMSHGGRKNGWTPSRIFARKTKRPRLDLSLGTSVDQPSPKCCSIANVFRTPSPVNGSSVPDMARTGSMDNCMKPRGFSNAPVFPSKADGNRVLENNGRRRFPLTHEDT